MKKTIQDTQNSYDTVAPEYTERYQDEMDDKPFDRDCLDRLAREVGELGSFCSGLGPGQIARYLQVNFHIGVEIEHPDESGEKPDKWDLTFYLPAEMEGWLSEAGFDLEEILVREPNPAVEVATRRSYPFARNPEKSGL